jgi:hypothetical protein
LLISEYLIKHEVFEFKSESGSELNINNSMIQGLHIQPYDVPIGIKIAEGYLIPNMRGKNVKV